MAKKLLKDAINFQRKSLGIFTVNVQHKLSKIFRKKQQLLFGLINSQSLEDGYGHSCPAATQVQPTFFNSLFSRNEKPRNKNSHDSRKEWQSGQWR